MNNERSETVPSGNYFNLWKRSSNSPQEASSSKTIKPGLQFIERQDCNTESTDNLQTFVKENEKEVPGARVNIPEKYKDFFVFHTQVAQPNKPKSKEINIFKCLQCPNNYYRSSRNNYGNLQSHLEKTHPDQWKEAKLRTTSEITLDNWLGKPSQVKLPRDDTFQIKADNALATMIAVDGLPMSIVKNLGFQNFVHVLNPAVTLKSATTIKEKIKAKAEKYRTNTANVEIPTASFMELHAMVDIWSTKSQESVLGIRIQHVDSEFKMQNKTLSFKKFDVEHNAKNIRQHVIDALKRFKIKPEQLGIILSDNAKNMLSSFNMNEYFNDRWDPVGDSNSNDSEPESEDEIESLQSSDEEADSGETIFGWDHLGCLVHKLQLVVKNAIDSDETVKQLIVFVNEIIVMFRTSPKWKAKLSGKTKKNLVAIGQTRWNSIYFALERIVDEDVFPHVFEIVKEYNETKSKKSLKGNQPKLLHVFSPVDKLKINELIQLLRPLKESSELLQGNFVTSSLVIPALLKIQNNILKMECQFFFNFKEKVLNNLGNRFKTVIKEDKFTLATLLDPRYKDILFGPKNNELLLKTATTEEARLTGSQALADIVSRNKTPSNTNESVVQNSDLTSVFDFLIPVINTQVSKSELMIYLEEATVPLSSDPLTYWKLNQQRFPGISKLAQIYLGFPASTGDVERLFSVAGFLKRQRRNKLDLHLLEDMLMVRNVEIPMLKTRLGKKPVQPSNKNTQFT